MTVRARTSWRHYLSWAALSQTLNAGSNVLLTLLLARSLGVRDFGIIAIGLAFLPLVVAGLRGMAFEPAVVHGDLSRHTARRVLVDSAVAGLVAGSCLLVTVVSLRGPILIAGILLVGAVATVVQEGARWVLFGLDLPQRAAGLDVLWAVVQVGVLAIGTRSPTVAALAWTAGAIVSAGAGSVAVVRSTEVRAPTPATRVWPWGLEYVVAAGTLQLAVLVAPITGGTAVAGGLRGAMSLLGAATVVLGGAQQAVAGRLRWIDDNVSLRRWGTRIGLALGAAAAVVSLPLLAIGDSLGRQLLGDTWPATRVVLPILIVQRVGTAVACGPAFALRKLVDHTSGVRWRLSLTASVLIGVMVGAGVGSEKGAASALAVGAIVSIPIWMRMLRTATREPPQSDESTPDRPLRESEDGCEYSRSTVG